MNFKAAKLLAVLDQAAFEGFYPFLLLRRRSDQLLRILMDSFFRVGPASQIDDNIITQNH